MNQPQAAQSPASQVDEAELAKFEAIAHRFWDPQGEFGTLHTLNPARLAFIGERTSLRGARVADVGCGGGLLAEALTRAGASVTAIDLAPSMIEVAKLHAAGERLQINYRVQSVESLATEATGTFDVVTCMEMLEHLPDAAQVVSELSRLLKPNGSLFVSTLNRNLRSFMLAIVGAEYVTQLVPRGTHEYERMIRPSELARWARDAHLTIDELGGLEYNPITRSARLTTDVSVNYLAHLRRAEAE
ncbi:MAG: bifunctional 2-polyprenyl-6-hydroxyphenol methylase/3-demethylubiquinol 3-O-methyltransferase UbiG [Gammaproteobacteria bacterium]|nr:bifunctional 2-polyprenyl-6-hydroxyphenol methylase/3-demethylubiquinol 3-O-methyltransferase UbiG [Gammaproteobacteria bacterium]